ncbi:MAG: FecR domain-containing protein [Mangrovibacterium sp.]|nr:FecR domain-containing protein [Mangrovibacterium sp.]
MDDTHAIYELLILKEFEGELSAQERKELDNWLQDSRNLAFYEDQRKLWQAVDEYGRMRRIPKKQALRKVEARLFDSFAVVNFRRKLERAAAILFIPLVLAGIWLFNTRQPFRSSGDQVVYNTVEVPLGMRSSMVLPDGTSVLLNAGSTLKYPVSFQQEDRRVELTGEAYFDVTKDKERPFIVSTSDIAVHVLGTSFNCSAYPDDEQIITALVEGEIEISGKADGQRRVPVKPGEVAVFTKQGKTIETGKSSLDKHIAWKSGKLIFRDDPMTTVLDKLGRWYNVEFQVEDEEILGYEYSATFSGESLDQVLKMLVLSAPISCELLPGDKSTEASFGKQTVRMVKRL